MDGDVYEDCPPAEEPVLIKPKKVLGNSYLPAPKLFEVQAARGKMRLTSSDSSDPSSLPSPTANKPIVSKKPPRPIPKKPKLSGSENTPNFNKNQASSGGSENNHPKMNLLAMIKSNENAMRDGTVMYDGMPLPSEITLKSGEKLYLTKFVPPDGPPPSLTPFRPAGVKLSSVGSDAAEDSDIEEYDDVVFNFNSPNPVVAHPDESSAVRGPKPTPVARSPVPRSPISEDEDEDEYDDITHTVTAHGSMGVTTPALESDETYDECTTPASTGVGHPNNNGLAVGARGKEGSISAYLPSDETYDECTTPARNGVEEDAVYEAIEQ